MINNDDLHFQFLHHKSDIIHYIVQLQNTKNVYLKVIINDYRKLSLADTEKGFDKVSAYSEVLELSEK